MPCYKPVKAFYGGVLSSGKRAVVFSSGQAQSCLSLALPCGTCVGCRLERARQWAMRCMDEASLYRDNAFITLTFSPSVLAKRGAGLDKRDFQLFMKRYRKFIGGEMVRYFHCGEYGSKFFRPHYHALLFNAGFPDRVYVKQSKAGYPVYRSPSLEANWPFGFSSTTDVTFGSAAYVARYHLKKVGTIVSDDHFVNPRTGEMLPPEYTTMSRGCFARGTGGLGKGWFDKFKSDVYPRDSRVIKGLDTKPCKFYDSLYEADSPEQFASLKLDRMVNAGARAEDNTEARLFVREKVKLAQLASLSCSLED